MPTLVSGGEVDCAPALEALCANPPPHSPLEIPAGTYLLCAKPTGQTLGATTAPLHIAVMLRRSGLHLRAPGVRWIIRGTDAPGIVDVNYAFGTDKNLGAGTLADLRFEGGQFDFSPAAAAPQAGENFRSFHFSGVDHLRLGAIDLTSTGARAGGTITVQNSRHVKLRRIAASNLTQAMNWRYVEDFEIEDFSAGHIGGEAIDFDSTVRRGKLKELRFNNPLGGPTGQALEIASGADIEAQDIYIRNYLRAITVLDKNTTPPTYWDYVHNIPVTVQTVSRDLAFGDVTIEDCAPSGFAVHVAANTGFAPERVTFEHLTMKRSGGIGARPGLDLKLRHFAIRDARTPAGTAYGAIYARADAGVPASIDLEDGEVVGASGSAVVASGTRAFRAARVALSGYAGRGFHVQAHAGPTIFEDTELGASTSGAPAATIYPAAGAPPAEFRGRNRWTGPGAPPAGYGWS